MTRHNAQMVELHWQTYDADLPGVSQRDVEQLQQRLGTSLPTDYTETLLEHGGMVTSLERVKVGRGASVFGTLFFASVDPQHRNHYDNVYKALDDLRDWGGEDYAGVLPFASNTASGMYCLDMRTAVDRPPVVFVDLDRDPQDDAAVVPVAEDFTAFLNALF